MIENIKNFKFNLLIPHLTNCPCMIQDKQSVTPVTKINTTKSKPAD